MLFEIILQGNHYKYKTQFKFMRNLPNSLARFINTFQISKITKDIHSIRSKLELNHWANEAMQSSLPIIRPMWMLNPRSQIALTTSDQFFVGDKV